MRIDGLLVQPTIVRPKARELIVGIADDATFGPVIVVGRGGTAVEVINDKALALPPLDLRLAHELIGQTRASRILKAYGDVPAADERALALALVKLAQLAADIPEVRTLDINPLLVDGKGILALDARVAVAPSRILHKGRGHPVSRCSRTRRSGSAPSNCPTAAAPSCARCGRRTTRCSARSSPASATRTCACASSSR
jgi:acetyltransferase